MILHLKKFKHKNLRNPSFPILSLNFKSPSSEIFWSDFNFFNPRPKLSSSSLSIRSLQKNERQRFYKECFGSYRRICVSLHKMRLRFLRIPKFGPVLRWHPPKSQSRIWKEVRIFKTSTRRQSPSFLIL